MDVLPQCLESLRRQDIEFEALIIDDGSTDPQQLDFIRAWCRDTDHSWLHHKKNQGALAGISYAIKLLCCDPDDIIVILDGDDWFPHDACLSRIYQEYQDHPDCLLTYGSYTPAEDCPQCPPARQYPTDVILHGLYRRWQSLFNHPISFKSILWEAVELSDLQYPDGTFFHYLYDHAIMYPMLEMANGIHRFIPDSLYVYNNTCTADNSANSDQEATGIELLSRPAKPPMRRVGDRLVPLGD